MEILVDTENYINQLEKSYQLAMTRIREEALSEILFSAFFTVYPETKKYFIGTDLDAFKTKKLKIIF